MHFPTHWNLAFFQVSPLEAIIKIIKSFQFVKSNGQILEIILHYSETSYTNGHLHFPEISFSLDFYNSFQMSLAYLYPIAISSFGVFQNPLLNAFKIYVYLENIVL